MGAIFSKRNQWIRERRKRHGPGQRGKDRRGREGGEAEGEKEGPGPTSRHVKVGSNFRDRAT